MKSLSSLKILQVSLHFHSRSKRYPQCILAILKGFTVCVSRESISTLSMKIHAYGGANLVPTALPEICCLTFESNSKKLFLSTNSAVSNKSVDGTFLFDLSSDFSYSALSTSPQHPL